MKSRLDYAQVSPPAFQAMLAFETYVGSCGFDPALLELIKTRASQSNGYAYCLDMHTKDARAHGETEPRLYALSAWRETTQTIRAANWQRQKVAGIDLIPSNDFSLYDQMLDMGVLLGAVPERFGWTGGTVDLATYFAMARGVSGREDDCENCGPPAVALEMTKWFDTNYHYLVPKLPPGQNFRLSSSKPCDEFAEALALGIRTMPVLIGPVTFLLLGKMQRPDGEPTDHLSLLPRLVPVYIEILRRLQTQGAEWVQLDEPALVLDLTPEQHAALRTAYDQIRKAVPELKLLLATYFGDLRDNFAAAEVIPKERLWVNPDCGLKTRRWEEAVPALKNPVEAARSARAA